MLDKLATALGKFVAAVIAGVATPVLVGVVVAEIKGLPPAGPPHAAAVETPAPAVTLLPPVDATRVEPDPSGGEWHAATDLSPPNHLPRVGWDN